VAFLAKRFLDKLISLEETVLKRGNESAALVDFFATVRHYKNATIIASLLHDIGHSPLSHTTESLFTICHEERGREIILGNTEINRLLADFDTALPQTICAILAGDKHSLEAGDDFAKRKTIPTSKLIAGQLDVDRMDYLLRDSYMTGSKYGVFDLEWLLNVLTVGVVNDRIEIGFDLGKGLSLAEDFVMARIYMFRNVYFHKISFVAQAMLNLLIARIKDLPEESTHPLFANESFRRVIFSDSALTLQDFLAVNDIDFFAFFKRLQTCDDAVLARLADGILNRRLFKEVDAAQYDTIRESIIRRKGLGMDKYFMYTPAFESQRKKLSYRVDDEKIYLFDKTGTGYELLEKSAILPFNDKTADFRASIYVDSLF